MVLGKGSLAGFFEHGNGFSGYVEEWHFLDKLSDYQLLKKNFALWN
jgi:hypothetical protein